MESLGDKIYILRNGAGISQDALAEKLNVSRQTVSRWETDSVRPTERNIKGLCAIFGVDRSYFSAEGVPAMCVPAEEAPAKNYGLKVFAVGAVALFLICCVAACCVASYVAFLPSSANGLNNAAVYRFRYIGIVCVVVGALALALFVCLSAFLIRQKLKRK